MPQKQPPANTATAVDEVAASLSSNAGSGISTACSTCAAACARPCDATSAATTAARDQKEACERIAELLAESESVRRDTGIEKLDLEGSIAAGVLLPDQLIEAVLLHDAHTVGVDVGAVIFGWRRAVERDAEPHGLAVGAGAEHEVQVARLEMHGNLAGRGVERRLFLANGPAPFERPLVEAEPLRHRIVVRTPKHLAARRREALGARVPDVGLRRNDADEIGCQRRAFAVRRDEIRGDRGAAGLGEQLLYHAFRLVVLAFAEVRVADVAVRVDEVVRGPVLIRKRAPDGVVVVDRDGIREAEVGDLVPHVARVFLERELR